MNKKQTPAETRILNARAQMILRHPFFGCLVLRLQLVEETSIPTMATNGRQLFYSPEFVCSLTEAELIFVLTHEVLHCAYLHFDRVGTRKLDEFNVAADYAINRDLVKQGIGKMPKEGLYDPKYGSELSAEEIHHMLYGNKPKLEPEKGEEQEPEQKADDEQSQDNSSQGTPEAGEDDSSASDDASSQGEGEGSEGEGSGQGTGDGQEGSQAGQGEGSGNGSGAEGETPAPADPRTQGGMGGFFPDSSQSPAEREELTQEWEMAVRQAVSVAKAHGSDPGEFARIIQELNKPTQDWRSILREFIEASTTKVETWKRPSTRFASSGLHMPGKRSDGINKLVCVIDTSGSIDMDCLSAFIAELNEAFDTGIIDTMPVLYNDVSVYLREEYVKGEIIETDRLKFRTGGTNFFDAMRIIAEEHSDAAGVLFFTDLIVNEHGIDPLIPVLWLTYGPTYQFDNWSARVPFGNPVHVTPDN